MSEFLTGVKIVFETNRYDCTLCGEAWYNNQYCYYDIVDWEADKVTYNLYKLEGVPLLILLAQRQLFNDIVRDKMTENWRDYWDNPVFAYVQGKKIEEFIKVSRNLIGQFQEYEWKVEKST